MINEITKRVRSGKSSAVAEVTAALEKAKKYQDYNVFINLDETGALAKARVLDEKIQRGEKVGRLAGVPYAIKDNYLDIGVPSTAAAKMLEDFKSPLQATVVKKLEKAGAIAIGKVNLDAFAHGGSTENSYFGPTLNAADKTRVAGGSSGGSAVAVALGIVPFALGSDTGGSIRQPASFNGVVGYKPTYGMVSRFGVVAMASSTDVMGCLAVLAEDAEIVMDVIAGQDALDSTTLPDFFEPLNLNLKGLKIGLVEDFMTEDVDESVRKITKQYVDKLTAMGCQVDTVKLPMQKYGLSVYYIVQPAEAASNLSRFDGVRYGYRSRAAKSLDEIYGMSRDEGFMTENKRRIMIGNFVLSSGFYDAYYLKAQKARTLLTQEFDKVFEDFDMLISPVTPSPAFKIGERVNDPIKMYLGDLMTVPASMVGLPAVSVPAGKTVDGLPVGVQLVGPKKSDAKLLALAKEMEKQLAGANPAEEEKE